MMSWVLLVVVGDGGGVGWEVGVVEQGVTVAASGVMWCGVMGVVVGAV